MTSGEHGVGRHASWLELFFDLVVVAAIAQLAHRLHTAPSATDVVLFVLLYLAVWLSWSSFTLYANVAGETTRRRSMLGAMFVIAVMAAAVPEATAERAVVFIVAYVVVRVLGMRIWHTTRKVMSAWPSVQGMFGVVPWIVSIWVGPPGRYALWTVGLAIDVLVPLVLNRRREPEVPGFVVRRAKARAEREGRAEPDLSPFVMQNAEVDSPHLAERLGLFVIIVLGEAVLQVVSAAAEHQWTRPLLGVALAGAAMLIGLWWHLFRYGLVANEGRGLVVRFTMPLHFLTTVSITAIAVGLGGLVAHPAGHAPAGTRWLLCGGLAGWALATALGALPGRDTLRWVLFAGVPGVTLPVLLGFFGAPLNGPALAWLLVAVVLWYSGYGSREDRRRATTDTATEAAAAPGTPGGVTG